MDQSKEFSEDVRTVHEQLLWVGTYQIFPPSFTSAVFVVLWFGICLFVWAWENEMARFIRAA